MRSSPFVCMGICLTFSLLHCENSHAEELKMWISTSVEQNIISKIRIPFEKDSGIKIVPAGDNRSASGPQYMKDVIDGKAEAAVTSQTFEAWAAEAKDKAGVTKEEVSELTYRVVGKDTMIVVCHSEVGVPKLTLEQLSDLFSGKISNWKSLGGADADFKIIFPQKIKVSSWATFKRIVLKNKDYGAPITDVRTYDDMVKAVAKTPGSCGFGPGGLKHPGVLEIQTPTIGRPSVLITKGKPSPQVQKLIDYIRTEGPKHGVE